MLSKKMLKALNDHLNFEMYSAYIYFSMAAYFENKDLPGCANWMIVQTKEEMIHAEKFYRYIVERDGKVQLQDLKGPRTEWDSPLAAFQEAYEHEQAVTGRINKLVDQSLAESDHATNSFLQWFVDEQVEEEASTKSVVQQLKMVGKDNQGLFFLDRELGTRVFTPPPATAA